MDRKWITPRLRFQILNRDNFECQYCWLKAGNWVQLQIDHKISIKDWWDNSIWNLITSCFECNIWKWSSSIDTKTNKVENLLWKQKLEANVKKKIDDFFKRWNEQDLWTIDSNTVALLSILYQNVYWEKSIDWTLSVAAFTASTRTSKKWVYKCSLLNKEFKLPISDLSINKYKKIFKEWWKFCDYVLDWIWCENNYWDLNDYFLNKELDWDLLNDKQWADHMDYCQRLNYILTELALTEFVDLFKNDFVLKKYWYYYKDIKNSII